MNNIHNITGSIIQLSLNERGESRNIYQNVAVDYQTYNFEAYNLTLSRNTDKIIPEYLILNLYDVNTTLETLFNYSRNIYINFKIGTQTLLNIPLSILWNLKEPEIYDNKLYLQIPFEMFFGDIRIVGLQFHEVTFNIMNYINLTNYVSGYGLICKTYTGDTQYRRQNTDTSNCCTQQISSLEVKVSLYNPESVSNEFRIKTNSFPGFSKGFFIESNNISELNELQFYIYDVIRINYNRFMIRNKCQRINANMIFMAFNPDAKYSERSFNSYVGSINLSEITQSTLHLNFDTPRASVKIYSINMNGYTQRVSEITTSQNIINTHLIEDFVRHSLINIDVMEPTIVINDLSVNSIVENVISLNSNVIIENDINVNYNNLYSGISNTNNNNYYITSSIDEIIVDIGINRLISEEKKICGITLEEISTEEKYMSCVECLNNFKEHSIRTWLTQRRTCPSCRSNWSDFNVYINM